MPTSTSILLPNGHSATTSSKPFTNSTTALSSAQLLKSRSIAVLESLNDRNFAAPYISHATPDFIYIHEFPPRNTKPRTASETIDFFHDTIFKNDEHRVRIMSSTVDVDEEAGHGVCWIGVRIKEREDGYMPGSEKVTSFYWRRDESGKWRWYKPYCVAANLPIPH
ncbi:hypothetical protein Slin14017_G087950 [Septoria linicola]|nr:hypothetical protein Slin14017_G087950 [Septoria linicola]